MPNPAATAAANSAFGLLLTELHKKGKKWRSVREDCEDMETALAALVAYSYDEMLKDDSSNVARARAKEVRELVHDIEDCIERFMYRITCMDGGGRLCRMVHAIKTWDIRDRFAKEMKKLNTRLEKAGVDKMKSSSGGVSEKAGAGRQRDPIPINDRPVGIAMAKQEFLTLLGEVGNESARLRVIAIVGFGGSGKTTLANAVYECKKVQEGFPLRAWVDRADYKDASELVKNIILKFWPEVGKTLAESSDKKVLRDDLKRQLVNQRYLIVLDDMDMHHWCWIQYYFRDHGTSSRIIVTTTRLSTANQCCTSSEQMGDGYVYHMRGLGDGASKTLARLNQVAHDSCVCQRGQGLRQCPSLTLQKKCNGHPLALVSVANHLNGASRGCPTTEDCAELCNNLGSFLHKNSDSVASTQGVELDSFADLRGVLTYNYNSLADQDTAAQPCCLLYLGIFPDAQCLKRNKITRRWVAEGYVQSSDPQKHADEYFKKLINQSMIQPDGISTSSTCKALGIVHEFVLHKSVSENFIMTLDDSTEHITSASKGYKRQRRARHLFVRRSNITSSGPTVNMDFSHVRSLTVTDNGDVLGSGSAGDGFFKFSKYKVIRVLDLGDCTEVNNSHMENICKLWNLRYLSLGNNVTKVPKEISQLNLLERLHLSKTVVTELPVDIIGMPSLIHLSGKFVLPVPGTEVSAELNERCKESKLETLSGIVADRRQGLFLLLVPQMKNLRKVKVCFGQSKDPVVDLSDPVLATVTGYLKRELGYSVPRSLCLDFKDLYETGYGHYQRSLMAGLCRSLSSGGNYYYLTSLKLHLQEKLAVSSMPDFIVLLSGVERLCLSLASVTQDLLSVISKNLPMLAHLKLKADTIHGDLEIHEGKLQSLESLCLVFGNVKCSIPQIHIRGGLPKLRSFQLLCQNLADLCGIDINRLEKLQEIELHCDVSVAARQQWETAARNHRNRPNVLPFLCVDDPAGAGMPAAVAAAITASEGAPLEHQVDIASMAVDEPDDEAFPATTATAAAAPVDHEPSVVPVPVADGAECCDEPAQSLVTSRTTTSIQPTEIPFAGSAPVGHEPAEVTLASSATANIDSSSAAKSVGDTVVSPEHSMPHVVIPNNNGSECPIDIDEAAPDATIPVHQPVRVRAR